MKKNPQILVYVTFLSQEKENKVVRIENEREKLRENRSREITAQQMVCLNLFTVRKWMPPKY